MSSMQKIISNILFKNHRIFGLRPRRLTSAAETNDVTSIKILRENLRKTLGIEEEYKQVSRDRAHLIQYLPKTQESLPTRSMKDSFLVGMIPLSSDPELREKYITFLGQVRVGRLLEDMDLFAVMVAQKHIVNPLLPEGLPMAHTLVTALVDRIDFSDYSPKPDQDIKISGHVSWVGKSSMEIVVWLEQNCHGQWERITRALFLMAARDSINKNSAIVNNLKPADEREEKILSGGEDRKKQRLVNMKSHVSKVIPDEIEQKIVHDLYLRTKVPNDASLRNILLPPGCVWMENSTIANAVLAHPENRNFHNTVFGGFLMRQATELSWVLGYRYSKYRPILRTISDINFRLPISVNSLIHMHAFIVFTQSQYLETVVYVETFDPHTGKNDTTNSFHFTYEVPETVKEVIPKTYHEAMMYVDGRRHFLQNMTSLTNIDS